ncbi:Zinc finger Y-chromosomal protein 1 [Mizuhopecten yessoensis]|uniref:Zinc finger Y-chromosomal protein 1 n=1 Tax=Mizuhopecten yessoensis TaxID=6573 RepID=A0A210Q3D4_MIZYE|nr:Zinc finger Y-chromosomal protein 1 [Mizuhopecten yessoensis]
MNFNIVSFIVEVEYFVEQDSDMIDKGVVAIPVEPATPHTQAPTVQTSLIQEKKQHTCEKCGRVFAYKQNLQYHDISQHTKSYPFKCQYCSKGFYQKYRFRQHVAKHTSHNPKYATNPRKKSCIKKKAFK